MKKSFIIILTIIAATICGEARQPREGYRGFFDLNFSTRTDNSLYFGGINFYTERCTSYFGGVSTTHGYQINSHVFAGVGISMEYNPDDWYWIIPVYADCRYDMQFGKFTPYADARLGVNLSDGIGLYFSPMVGYRFNWGRKVGLNLGMGLTLASYSVVVMEGEVEPGYINITQVSTTQRIHPYFSIRFGIDF